MIHFHKWGEWEFVKKVPWYATYVDFAYRDICGWDTLYEKKCKKCGMIKTKQIPYSRWGK